MRDLVLAKEYAEADIYFATMDLSGNINHKIDEVHYKRVHLNTNNLDELDKIIKELKIEMIVIDHYGIDYHYEKQLKIQNPKLKILSLDDTYEKHHCDILLNHNICADKKRYKDLVPPHCELRCGAKYTLLRDEFKKEKEIQREKIYDIFLAMGGADTAELNIPILKILSPNLKIAVLTTNANRALQELKEFAKNSPNIALHINSNEVAKLLNESRFAIITPSVTVNEVLFMEVPFLAIKTASNQDDMYKYLKKNGYMVMEFKSMEKFNDNFLKNFKNSKLFYNHKTSLINFIDLSLDEKMEILKWRNDESIRKWMYNQKKIEPYEHLDFINSLIDNKSKCYFFVHHDDRKIGVIDFTNIDFNKSESDFGLYANPFEKISKKGTILLQSAIQYAFKVLKLKKLKLEVFAENEKALNLYRMHGFKEVGIKIIGKKDIVCMELIKIG